MKKAFTLAEVLITLGIIGVVAALVTPSVIAKHQEKAVVTKLKKAYSVLANAYKLAENERGSVDSWVEGKTMPEASLEVAKNMKPYLNISKDCGFSGGCFKDAPVITLSGQTGNNYGVAMGNWETLILADGTSVLIQGTPEGLLNLAIIFVDIDGFKGANTYGKDIFLFRILPQKGVFPAGLSSEGSVSVNCNRIASNGNACAGWVIMNENMDYLHCDDLSWNNKTKCK